MKKFILSSVIGCIILIASNGCTVTQPIKQTKTKSEFFSPVKARMRTTTQPQIIVDQSAEKHLIALRDSLARVTKLVDNLQARIAELEARQLATLSKQSTLEKQLEFAQSEGRKLSQEISDLRSSNYSSKSTYESLPVRPAYHATEFYVGYEGALNLFMQRQYSRAIDSFRQLQDMGIQEVLADNCEYWIGESYFAKKKYQQAIKSFENVISWPQSNKQADAYFMLGRCYEQLGDMKKARWAYEQLVQRYPNSDRYQLANSKLQQYRFRENKVKEIPETKITPTI